MNMKKKEKRLYSAMCEVLLLFKGHITPLSSGSIHDEAPYYSCIHRYKRKKHFKTACDLLPLAIVCTNVCMTNPLSSW